MSQLVNELKRCSKYANRVQIVPLTSRKGLCVHEKLKDLDGTHLHDKCEELQETKKCEHRDDECVTMLSDTISAQPMDIEELGTQAAKVKICGYYAAR